MADDDNISVPAYYLGKLEQKVAGLSTLIDISEIISSTMDLDALMDLVMDKAKLEMEAEACSILFYNKQTNKLEFEVALCGDDSTSQVLRKTITLEMGQGIAGWVAENLKPIIIDDVSADDRFFKGVDAKTGFTTKNLIAIPLVGRTGLIGVAEIINYGKKDYNLEILQLLCRQFAVAIENAMLYRESIQKERLKQELEIAAILQRSFLPESPTLKRGAVTLSALNISAAKVGGDLYDFIEPSEGLAGVLIGDVSGKGVSAALYMAKIVSDFRYAARNETSPSSVFNALNPQLSKSPRGMFLTAVYVIVDRNSGETEISSAGHPPLLWITGGEVKVLAISSGPPLGIVPVEYSSTPVRLSPGDRLLMFTDGLFDARDKDGGRIGFDNIVEFVRGHTTMPDLIGGLASFVSEFEQGAERADDITIVEVKFED
ncbi:MAG: SpoIIE family protein phosphatase [Nitrospirae bacterium]|nr:SpoIIE family protein phosphatase [Nitrospirota bacterium]